MMVTLHILSFMKASSWCYVPLHRDCRFGRVALWSDPVDVRAVVSDDGYTPRHGRGSTSHGLCLDARLARSSTWSIQPVGLMFGATFVVCSGRLEHYKVFEACDVVACARVGHVGAGTPNPVHVFSATVACVVLSTRVCCLFVFDPLFIVNWPALFVF
ncbi:hypothetical protein D1007_49606 [Hordeum vulgare]|nr:hypothetical protein D1007_49606 [Hordeum vulgare]